MKILVSSIIFLFSIYSVAQEESGRSGPSGRGCVSGSGNGRDFGVQYNLQGRKKEVGAIPDMAICKEEGRIAVKIYVDRTGEVKKAEPGYRGTTNKSECVLEEARKAAMRARFDAKENAPELQVGVIVYTFSLDDLK